MDFKLFIKLINVIKLFNLALIEKNYTFIAELRLPLSLQAVSTQFSIKQREILKDQVRTLPVLFKNSHVSQL